MIPRNLLAVTTALLIVLLVARPSTSAAQAVTPGAPVCIAGLSAAHLPAVDARVFVVEGPIQGFDVAQRTIRVAGVPVRLPPTLLVDTNDDEMGDVPLSVLFDPVLEAQRSLVGGNATAKGVLAFSSPGCFELIATFVHAEVAEHVLVGALTSVDPVSGRFSVLGVPVAMNTDPRFPSELLGAGGGPISLALLSNFLGTLVSVEGYLENGVMRGAIVETEAYATNPTGDTVVVEKAVWDASKRRIDVRGFVTASLPSGQLAVTVDLHLGALLPGGSACSGPIQVSTPVTPEAPLPIGQFRYVSPDNSYPTMPLEVCVRSRLGGAVQRTFEIHL